MACAVLAEVLDGGGQGGTYQYDQKLKLSSKATDGMVGAPWLAEEKLDENTTLPRPDSFRRRKREAGRADGFCAGVHAEFDRQGRQAVREFKSSYSYERYSVDETVNNANTVSGENVRTGARVSMRGRGLGTRHDRLRARKVNCSVILRPRNSGSNPAAYAMLCGMQVTVKGNIADFLVPGLKCTSSFALPATSPSKVGAALRRQDRFLVDWPAIAPT